MKLVLISDTHNQHGRLNLPSGDMLIHTGDVSMNGNEKEIAAFLDWFSSQEHPHKVFIAGNHDFYFERNSLATIQKRLPGNVVYLNDSGIHLGGLHIWGSPVTPWFHNWAFNRHRGAEIRKHWSLIPEHLDLLLTHGPAFRHLDSNDRSEHLGCRDLSKRVRETKPRLHIFGHIHHSYGMMETGNTSFINASMVNEDYELVNKPVLYELQPGAEIPH